MELQYNEATRSKIWKVVMVTSSIVIVLVGVYLMIRLFTNNPLAGTWQYEDGDMRLTLKNKHRGVVRIQGMEEGTTVDVKVEYTLDKEEKTLRIQANKKATDRLLKKGYSKELLENQMDVITNTFDYSVEEDRLTLSEREYGDQLVFRKQ